MKTRYIILATLCTIGLTISVSVSVAQVADSTVWQLFSATGSKPTISTNLAADSNLVGPATGWIKTSYNTNGQRCNFAPSPWPAGAETDTAVGRYIEFTTRAVSGRSLTVTTLSFNYGGAGSTNAERAKVFYTIDNWKTFNLVTTDSALLFPNSTMSPFAKTLNVKVPASKDFSVRIYPYWVATTAGSATKYCVLNTMVVSGTTASATGVNAQGALTPAKFDLSQNYPNPFNPSTNISFDLETQGFTTLKVFNIIGNEVATLVNGMQEAGSYTLAFDASALPSGVYFTMLTSGGRTKSMRMVLMK